MRWRTLLLVATVALAALYAVVVLVALVVSGAELLRQPAAYYAALMPFVYFGMCIATATGHLPTRQLRRVGTIVHVVALPCVALSFLGLGLLLPLLAFVWFRVYLLRTAAEGADT